MVGESQHTSEFNLVNEGGNEASSGREAGRKIACKRMIGLARDGSKLSSE